jgi:hypothetical protein
VTELTEEQRRELASAEPTLIDPKTMEAYVLVRKDLYEQLKKDLYDDSPWTDAEMDRLADEAGELADRYAP